MDENNMYHYNEQGTGQYQTNTSNTQASDGQYHYAESTQPEESTQQTYSYGNTDHTGGYQYGNTTQQNTGDQFTGGQNHYNAGTAYGTYQSAGTGSQPPAHGKAVASLVLGIAGLVCCGICGLIGLILAVSAKNEGNNEGIRTAGFVLGVIGCVLWGVGVVAAIINGAFTAAL